MTSKKNKKNKKEQKKTPQKTHTARLWERGEGWLGKQITFLI